MIDWVVIVVVVICSIKCWGNKLGGFFDGDFVDWLCIKDMEWEEYGDCL